MTSFDQQAQQQQTQQQQAGGQSNAMGPPQPAEAPIAPAQTPAQGLAPTGVSQQLQTLNATYQAQAMPQTTAQLQTIPEGVAGPGGAGPQPGAGQQGSSNVQQMAQRLAQGYGLPVGRNNIVDESGNFLMTPDQMAQQGGMRMGEAAAKMNYVAQALSKAQTEQQQQKGIAALQTGVGLVQSRGRGSLAAMQSGFYQDLADMYSNQEYAAADFSYFIEAERFDRAEKLMRRQEKLAKKGARMGFIGGILAGGIGLASGNYAMAAGGIQQAGGAAAGTGWF